MKVVYNNEYLDSKLKKAVEYLGKKWILHPEYKPSPTHLRKSFEY